MKSQRLNALDFILLEWKAFKSSVQLKSSCILRSWRIQESMNSTENAAQCNHYLPGSCFSDEEKASRICFKYQCSSHFAWLLSNSKCSSLSITRAWIRMMAEVSAENSQAFQAKKVSNIMLKQSSVFSKLNKNQARFWKYLSSGGRIRRAWSVAEIAKCCPQNPKFPTWRIATKCPKYKMQNPKSKPKFWIWWIQDFGLKHFGFWEWV